MGFGKQGMPLSTNEFLYRLEQVKWTAKQDLYGRYFEQATTLHEISEPELSVVIISWRLHADTKKNLLRLQQQKAKVRFEIIFVDNGGQVGEFESLMPYIDKYIRLNTNTGAYLARNVGSVYCSGPIVLFLEDDGIPDEQLIQSHLLVHHRYDAVAVRGVYLPKTENPLNDRQSHYYLGDRFFPMFSSVEGNSSYSTSAFREVGGWDDQIHFGGGGKELALRLLKRFPNYEQQIYSPISIIYHDYATDCSHLLGKWEKQRQSLQRLTGIYPEWFQILGNWRERLGNETLLRRNPDYCGNAEHDALFTLVKHAVASRNKDHIARYLRGNFLLADPTTQDAWLQARTSQRYICVFGAGSFGDMVYRFLRDKGYPVSCFADNNPERWGQEKFGIPIISPDKLSSEQFILVASTWYWDIVKQLEGLGLERDRDFAVVR